MKAVLVYADGRTESVNDCGGTHWWLVPRFRDEPDNGDPSRYRPFVQVDPAVANGQEMLVYVEQPWEHFQSPRSAGGITVTKADKEPGR